MSHAIATDQREHRRLQLAPTIIRADIEQDGKRREGYLINVSLGGTFLSIADPPAKDTTTDLHMVLPWGIGEVPRSGMRRLGADRSSRARDRRRPFVHRPLRGHEQPTTELPRSFQREISAEITS